MSVVAAGVILPACEAVARQPLEPRLEERLTRGNYGYAYGIAAADVDGDGDLDLFSSDTTDDTTPEMVNGTLMWLENDGRGGIRSARSRRRSTASRSTWTTTATSTW